MTSPVAPRYEASSLGEVVPAVGARLGVPGCEDRLGLPDADRYVVLLIDGLGEELLRSHPDVAPHLTAGLASARRLTSTVPSTTATALTSLGTGLPPGQHGIAGFSFRHPFADRVLNALAWERGLSGLDVQPRLTALERLARDRVEVTIVAPAHFAGTGLTESGLRGGRFSGVVDESDAERRIEQTVDAATASGRTFVYCYERSVDHEGHEFGVDSPQWRAALAWSDALAAGLRAALPPEVVLLVTADHGMLDVPEGRLILQDDADLSAGLDLIAGEARFRHLYTAEPDAVASRWRDRLGEDAWVRTRDEAIDEGWFGDVAPPLARRFGDVCVAMRGTQAVLTRTTPQEFGLVGMHGSLTAAEMYVPLIVE